MQPGQAPTGNSALPGGYATSFSITGITQASQAVITATTTLQVGQTVIISSVNGMIELNGNTYTVVAVDGTTVTINVDSTGFTAWTSGGNISSLNNVINYLTGVAMVSFPEGIPDGVNINAEFYYFNTGLPRAILFYNNTLTLRSVPDAQYLIELDAYLSPAAFLSSSDALPFGYMSEYFARGAARKILSDTGDFEQFNAYEPLFVEQELLVVKRSERQRTTTRTPTIYSNNYNKGVNYFSSYGGNY